MAEDEEESQIRERKRLEQRQMAEAKKAEEQLKATLRVVLEEDAYNRMTNVKLANSELYFGAAQHVVSLYKRFGRKIKDSEILLVLRRMKEGKEKETKISFERK